MEKLLKQLRDAEKTRKCEMILKWDHFLSPINLKPENDYVNLVFDARYLNFMTKTAIFDLKEITPVAGQSLAGSSEDAGMYSRSELRRFRDNILVNAASRTALRKFFQTLIF